MSEEKPTFKVTDRRLFNPDGTPREGVEREEPAAPNAAEATAQASTSDATAARAADAGAPATNAARADQREGARAASASAGAQTRENLRGEERRGEESHRVAPSSGSPGDELDPTPFANLVMFVASPAAAAMGMTEHPGMPPGEVDLPLAKHCIDLLVTVRDKTRGNLSQQEQQILEGLLAELQMQYVSLTSTRRQPRGFSGSDITGGR
ncbi:MAG: DUF1844 domain-containing protein [Acidobacteria bacterium]|nr:DUF1844 domain-containing protein [Acidobacteriota bacterium]